MPRLTSAKKKPPPLRGVRVVIDARPIQEPDRSPLTADYLDHLLRAFAKEPLHGESFVVISRALRPDPSDELAAAGLPVAGRRVVPPTTRVFRSAGLTLDSFLLRGAEMLTAGGGDRRAVFHTAGGAVPVGSRLPIVATLLDLAPWELPGIYASSAAARFGHRLRARVLHDATRVIVCSRATAESARRHLRLPAERIAVVPLAVDEAFRAAGQQPDLVEKLRKRLSLPPRYLVFAGRYDARKDLRTLFEALRMVRDRHDSGAPGTRSRSRRGAAAAGGPQPPIPTVIFAVPSGAVEDQAVLTGVLERSALGDMARTVVVSDPQERAQLIAGAEGFVYPALSEGTALPAVEALALGIPVICSRAGALPEVVGSAGIVVAPRDQERLAAAIEALWEGGSLADQLRRQAHRRAEASTRTWSDVARETREVYVAAAETRA